MSNEEIPTPVTREWQEDETLVLSVSFSYQNTKLVGDCDIQFADHIDCDKFPQPRLLEEGGSKGEDGDAFAVIPASSWNRVQKALKDQKISQDDLRQMSIGRAFKIPLTNTIFRNVSDKGLAVFLKLTPGIDHHRCDLIDTVRWGKHFVREDMYPFVVVTIQCWNYFQRTVDKLQIRDTLRKTRPVAGVVRRKDVTRVTHLKFEEYRLKLMGI